MNRKAQSAVEFVALVSFMMIVFFGFFFMIQNQVLETTQKQNVALLGSLNNIIVSQLEFAQSSPADFRQSFTLPVLESDYSVDIVDPYELVGTLSDGTTYVDFLPYSVRGVVLDPGTTQYIYLYDGSYTHPVTKERIYNSLYEGLFINLPIEDCVIANLSGACATLSGQEVLACQTIKPSVC